MAARQQMIADRYELKHVVGSGGMSTVHCAFDTLLERNVALKILHDQYGADEEYVERFRREARSVAQLSHPNIVTVIDRGEEAGKQFIVFELIEGDNVKELVERGGPLPVRRALELGLEIARALAFAHGQGIVHRDVKPQNVLLNDEGHAKVTDFGIAYSLNTLSNTQTGTVLGTSHYIAPEQARGEHVDAQTDIYSFGVVFYELLTGELPYSGDNFLTVAMKHVNEPVPSVFDRRPDTPLRLASLIERCMAKDPADRPASMDNVIAELEACRAELDGKDGGEATMILRKPAAVPARTPRKPARRAGKAPVLAILAGVLLAAAAAGIYLAARDDDNPGAGAATGPPVALSGVGAFDPEGGDGEHDSEAPLATDGQAGTYWQTSRYRSSLSDIGKSGVGVVVDAGGARSLSQIAVITDTPGFTAEIKAGDSAEGPFETVAAGKAVGRTTTWDLDDSRARFYVVWITDLGDQAQVHINEVKAT